MRFTLLLAASLLASLVAGTMPVRAQSGAIAYDSHNCAWGDSWNFPNPGAAADRALANCKHPGCRVVAQIGPRQCAALAATADCHGWGWASRGGRAEAELGAMQECQKYNAGQCTVRLSDCNR
jgi:hypothetical protein